MAAIAEKFCNIWRVFPSFHERRFPESSPLPLMTPNDVDSLSLPGHFQQSLKKTGAAAGGISFVAGFVSDVLQPLAPLANYLLILSVVAIVVLGLMALVAKGTRGWAIPMTVLAFFVGLFSGAVVALQKGGEQTEERGIVAANVPAIAQFQETLGLIQKNVAEIKETTVRIEEKTDKVLESVESMASSFSELGNQGGIIPNPETPQQHYHNARLYELKGDYGNARRSYLAYFNFDLEFLDPHLRFQEFLKVQEGRSGARESYQYIANRSKTMIPKLAATLLWDRDKRVVDLGAFIAQHPDFAAAYYLLSQDYSMDRLGTQSLDDQRKEKELLETFQRLDGEGNFVRYFLDKEMVAAWQADATKRLASLQAASARMENPVTATWTSSNSGWMGYIQIVEPTLEILWREAGKGDFKSTGNSRTMNQATGKPHPNTTITLPNSHPQAEFEVKYVNAAGVEMGPYPISFDPISGTLEQSKQVLELTKQAWVSFRDWDGKVLCYFTHLMTHRGVFTKITYGINQETPNQEFEFPAYNQPGNAPIGEDVPTHIEVPADTQFITVQVLFRDGTESEVNRYVR